MSATIRVCLGAGLLLVLATLSSCQGYRSYHSMNSLHGRGGYGGGRGGHGGGGLGLGGHGHGAQGGYGSSHAHNPFMGFGMNPAAHRQNNCAYLKNAKSTLPYNAGAFKIYTRSRAAKVTKGTPIEVTIGPFSRHLSMFNFTSFILYAQPIMNPNMEMEMMGGQMNANRHVGVFQLFSQWSAGAGGLSCGPHSHTDDSVAAFEDLIMPPGMVRPARNQVSVLWWPTSDTLVLPRGSAIKFVANIQSGNKWYRLQSTPWKIHRPIDQWALTERMFNQFGAWRQHMMALERRMDQPV